jgi:hypothetical protein
MNAPFRAKDGCPILATFSFLSQGWETTNLNRDLVHRDLNFHALAPVTHGIWKRFQFLEGGVLEGIVFNSISYMVDPGFFLLLTDPASNNRLVYVLKSWIVDHRVLGVRKL